MNKVKLNKLNTRALAFLLSSVALFTAGGCAKSVDKEANTNNSAEQIDPDSETLSIINNMKDNLNNNLSNKFYLNDDDQISSITLLNIDYILKSATYDENGNFKSSILTKLYPKGLNTNKELNDLNTFLSKYREYNLHLDGKEFMTISDYALIEQDKIIISKLESMTKELINLVDSNATSEEVNNLFNIMYDFYVKDGSIVVGNKSYKKSDLSNGFSKGSEVFGNIVSVYSRNYVNEETRSKLDKRLNTKDSLYKIEVLLEKFANTNENVINMMINDDTSYVLTKEDEKVINSFKSIYDIVMDSSSKFNATYDEVKGIVNLANIDYLASDEVSAAALKTIIGEDAGLMIDNATKFIKKADNYNYNNQNDLFVYNNVFINDSENIANLTAIQGSIVTSIRLKANSTDLSNNKYFNFIQYYNGYSNKASFKTSDGSKIVKNDTGRGTRYITNRIFENALEYVKTEENAELVENAISIIDNNNEDRLSELKQINNLIREKCESYELVK